MSETRPPGQSARRSQVLAWGLWDVGATGVNAIVTTFVFSVYLTSTVGDDLPGGTTPQSWLFRALAVAGLVVAVLAPLTGVWVDAPWRRRRVLALLTGLVVLLTASMSLVRDDYHYLWLGLVLLGGTAACGELSDRALQRDAAPALDASDIGPHLRVRFRHGLFRQCHAAADRLCRVHRGRRRHPRTARNPRRRRPERAGGDAARRRVVRAVRAAASSSWCPSAAADRGDAREDVGLVGAYRKLWREIVGEWRRDHNIVYYLFASAVFRDGLTGVFAFGAVLGVSVYGISSANVLLFGVSASVIAALGAFLGGLVDDRLGSKPRHPRLAGLDDRDRAGPAGRCPDRSASGSVGCCSACSSGRRSRRRGR